MNRPLPVLFAVCTLLAVCASVTPAGEEAVDRITIPGDKGDDGVDRSGSASGRSLAVLGVGTGGNDLHGHGTVFFFALPTLPSRDSIVAAELQLQYLGIRKGTPGNYATPTFNADMFGLGARANATVTAADFHEGKPQPQAGTLIAKAFLTPSTAPGRVRIADTALLDHVASLYQPDGKPIAAFDAFRANADVSLPVDKARYQGYELASADNTEQNGAYVPQLKLTVVRPAASTSAQLTQGPPPPAEAPTDLRPMVWILGVLLAVCLVVIAALLRAQHRNRPK